MNVCLRNTFIGLWFFMGVQSLASQGATLYFPFINDAVPGNFINVPLKAVNLDSVVSFQLAIRWNPAVLKFSAVNTFGLGDMSPSDFNTTHAIDSGYIRVQWEGSSATPGVSVPDSGTVFRLRFVVIGTDTSSTPVQITELLDFPPTFFEIVKVREDGVSEDYLINECPRINGFVAVGFTVATTEPGAGELPLSLSPNPFSESSDIIFSTDETADTQLIIAAADGRIVFEKTFLALPAGQHGMVIEKSMLGVSGTYSLMIRAGRKTATSTLVFFNN